MVAETVDRETGELVGVEEERSDFPDARLNPRFIVTRGTTRFVTYAGLLDLLHQASGGFFVIETELLQLPSPENAQTAICRAVVRVLDTQDADLVRRVTTGLGDANPGNVNRGMDAHIIRLAETRAKARALRDAVNVGMAALEELGPESEARGEGDRPAAPAPQQSVERIKVGETLFTRPEVVRTKRARVEACQDAGLALPVPIPADEAPLSDQVGFSQRLRELLLQHRRGSGK
jgi:hypothetical protein